jgi:hypothetical protein
MTIHAITPTPCGCGIPNRSAYQYVIPVHRIGSGRQREAILRIFRCVKHRVDPLDHAAVRSMFEFDSPQEWVIESVECKPTSLSAAAADARAAFSPEEHLDLRLRSESEEEDVILRHFRGVLHNGAQCRACKQEQYERRVGDRRVEECRTEIARLRTMLNSIIEGP